MQRLVYPWAMQPCTPRGPTPPRSYTPGLIRGRSPSFPLLPTPQNSLLVSAPFVSGLLRLQRPDAAIDPFEGNTTYSCLCGRVREAAPHLQDLLTSYA